MNIPLLDHGYLRFIEHWGSEERIIEAARMSTDKGFQGWGKPKCENCGGLGYHEVNSPTAAAGYEYRRIVCVECNGEHVPGDEKLLAYLYSHRHHTPFEMAGMIIEVQAPIFVFREWHRHRTQSYNELSARYVELPNMFYEPSVERLMMSKQGALNKQSSQAGISPDTAISAGIRIIESCAASRDDYEALIAMGISREVARIVIPTAQYSRMRASANLRNWLAFLTLRMNPAAQWEIRQYANAMHSVLVEKFPRTMELFDASH